MTDIFRSSITDTKEGGQKVKTGETIDGVLDNKRVLFPYGFQSNVKIDSNTESLIFRSSRNSNTIYCVPYNVPLQDASLKEGEVIVGNQVKKNQIKFKEDGTIAEYNDNESRDQLLSDLITIIKDIVTTGSPTTHTINAATKTLLDNWETRMLTLYGPK